MSTAFSRKANEMALASGQAPTTAEVIAEVFSTGLATAAQGAKADTALQVVRQTFSNADVTVDPTTTILAQTGTLTASKLVTLPLAASVRAGWGLVVADESGTVTASNYISLSRAGSDTINGTTYELITTAYGQRRLISDGVSKWSIDAGLARVGVANTFAANQTWNGTNNTAPNQVGVTPGSTTTIIKSQSDTLYGKKWTGAYYRTRNLTGTVTTTSGGSVTFGGQYTVVRTNAGAGNRAATILELFTGTTRTNTPWNVPIRFGALFYMNGDNRSTLRILLGCTTSYTSGVPTLASIGIRIDSGGTVTAVIGNGTTEADIGTTSVAISGTAYTTTNLYQLNVSSDGAGNVVWSMNGTQFASSSSGPTSAAATGACFALASASSASASTNSDLVVAEVEIQFGN